MLIVDDTPTTKDSAPSYDTVFTIIQDLNVKMQRELSVEQDVVSWKVTRFKGTRGCTTTHSFLHKEHQ